MDINRYVQRLSIPPGRRPSLEGIDMHGSSVPANGVLGGDLLLYVDFDERYDLEGRIERAEDAQRKQLLANRSRGGILIADVAGHGLEEAIPASQLARAFLLGARYELDDHGEITTRLFEKLNTEFYRSEVTQLISMLYGEISSNGRFRYISAAHPPPMVHSLEFGRFVTLEPKRTTGSFPIGTAPSADDPDRSRYHSFVGFKQRYHVNELVLLNSGDTMLLITDGVSENPGVQHFDRVLRDNPGATARALHDSLMAVLDETDDDCTLVVVKKR